ncbi:MAG: glycosyltransferase family 4 protein [Candidatus Sumerlaeia bacterium]|nr:glycosyltransferase family 4 protein [Candidatus Sumerlaeia bacterium]
MNILFLNEKCGFFGGVEQTVFDSASGLRERGHKTFLGYGELARDVEFYRMAFEECIPLKEFGGAGEASVLNVIQKHSVELLYAHKWGRMSDWPKTGIPVVRMIHDHDLCCPRRHKYFLQNQRVCEKPFGVECWFDLAFVEKNSGGILPVRWKNLSAFGEELKAHQQLECLMVGSRFMLRELEMNGFSKEQLRVVPPVIRREAINISSVPTEPSLLFVGQLIRGKGVDLLLRALAQLKVPYTATIIGDGNARSALEAQARVLGIREKVRFTGWIPNAELGTYYQNARVVAVPSRWPEPFGMIGLEAMHYGRPVVAFEVGGIPDWLMHNQTGLLVPEQDVSAYTEALRELLTDHKRCVQMGVASKERITNVFRFENYLDQLEQEFQRLIGNGVSV